VGDDKGEVQRGNMLSEICKRREQTRSTLDMCWYVLRIGTGGPCQLCEREPRSTERSLLSSASVRWERLKRTALRVWTHGGKRKSTARR
jgi:hypothetical protein